MDDVKTVLEKMSVDMIGIVDLDQCEDPEVVRISRELLPSAKSVIVLAMELFPELVKFLTSGRQYGELVLRDLFNRNADIANGHLDWEAYKLVKNLHRLNYQGVPMTAGNAPFDSRFLNGMLSYKASAVAAGMGTIGWNTMLLTPEFGARVRLSCVVTDAPAEQVNSVAKERPCEKCGGACVKVCPVNALQKPGPGEISRIDKFLCNNYINSTGGCSECLRVCPADRLFKASK